MEAGATVLDTGVLCIDEYDKLKPSAQKVSLNEPMEQLSSFICKSRLYKQCLQEHQY